MRDPNRILAILAGLGNYWARYPDLRLGQILGNFEIGYNTEDSVLLETLGRLEAIYPAETLDQKVERIAHAWFESPGPDGEPVDLDWDTAHPGDKDSARHTVAFVLARAQQ